MQRRRRNYFLLILSLLFLIGLVYLIIYISPNQVFQVLSIKISVLLLFFLLTFLFIFSFMAFWLKNLRRGMFFGFLIIGLLLLLFYRFIHPFFIIMLIALFGVLELFFSHRR